MAVVNLFRRGAVSLGGGGRTGTSAGSSPIWRAKLDCAVKGYTGDLWSPGRCLLPQLSRPSHSYFLHMPHQVICMPFRSNCYAPSMPEVIWIHIYNYTKGSNQSSKLDKTKEDYTEMNGLSPTLREGRRVKRPSVQVCSFAAIFRVVLHLQGEELLSRGLHIILLKYHAC